MLRRLSIQNYLLIEQLELDLGPGLTVITGETGSGKSIVIGALGLAMGERAEGNLPRHPAKRCVIELEVEAETGSKFVDEWCRSNSVPHETPMILRRQLEPGGRSRAFVNDTPVRLEQLRELGEGLVHVHSQHHTLLLNTPAFQLGLLDHFIGHGPAVKTYAERYHSWRKTKDELAAAREQEAQAQSERDYLQFQFEELEAARLVAGAYVPFVLWFNFLAGFAYVIAAIGLWNARRWAARLAIAIAVATALVFVALGAHIFTGGSYEMRTVMAMSLRTLVWTVIAVIVWTIAFPKHP